MKTSNAILYYNIVFHEESMMPQIMESIKVDENMRVELQYMGNPVPLPPWFVYGRDARLNNVTQLEELPKYIKDMASSCNSEYSILTELEKRKYYKPTGRPPFSSEVIRFALLTRYTSAQAYRLMLEKFPLPSFSTLAKIQQGGIDALKAVKLLLGKGEISKDIIIMVDEMYLQKGTQYHSGNYVGADQEGNLYKGIVAFMIVGLRKSIPYIIKASPEVTISGNWLSNELDSCISELSNAEFNVRGIVADNHSCNVNAYSILRKKYNSHPDDNHITVNNEKIYMFYDNPHILKNIRNNLLHAKKFVFPALSYTISEEQSINIPAGYISWANLHNVHEMDQKLPANLRKAPDLTFRSLHPGDNKQSVPLALAIFAPTTIAAVKIHFPDRPDFAGFLELISKWWIIINSNSRYSSNKLGNAFTHGDGKPDFLRALANYLSEWSTSSSFFCLTKQTSDALIRTLKAQASLIEDLLSEGYDYVVPRRFQSDPLEKRFSRYRQMSGGRFLVSLREVLSSERIISVSSLLKENINFWEENISADNVDIPSEFIVEIDSISAEIQETSLCESSVEVASTIGGYIAKKLIKRTKCDDCKKCLVYNDNPDDNKYLKTLSRGKLIMPSKSLANFTCNGFAVLDMVDPLIQRYMNISVREAGEYVMKTYCVINNFTCNEHYDWGLKFASKIVVNIFYNNKQKLDTDAVRKSDLEAFKRRQRKK